MCLESKDYTQIRNTIMVLTKVGAKDSFISFSFEKGGGGDEFLLHR